jgi:hypothetical protein
VLKTKDPLDDTIVLCMIVRLIVYSAYNYSSFAFGLYYLLKLKTSSHAGDDDDDDDSDDNCVGEEDIDD